MTFEEGACHYQGALKCWIREIHFKKYLVTRADKANKEPGWLRSIPPPRRGESKCGMMGDGILGRWNN